MAIITKLEFPVPHGAGMKSLHMLGHAAFALMKHVKSSGESVKFHFDDGSVVDYVPTSAADNAAGGMEISLTPGVEA